eukprot:783279-Prymnesium_polylepis.1
MARWEVGARSMRRGAVAACAACKLDACRRAARWRHVGRAGWWHVCRLLAYAGWRHVQAGGMCRLAA